MREALRLTASMELAPPAPEAAVAEAERRLEMTLPRDYVEFLLVRNGGEGPVGRKGWA